MTNEQILELADEFLEEWEADEDGRTWKEYSGNCEDILDFARAIYETWVTNCSLVRMKNEHSN